MRFCLARGKSVDNNKVLKKLKCVAQKVNINRKTITKLTIHIPPSLQKRIVNPPIALQPNNPLSPKHLILRPLHNTPLPPKT